MLVSFASAYKELASLPKEDDNRKSVIVPIDGNADPASLPSSIAAVFTTEIIYLTLKQEEENNTFVGVTTPHDLVKIVTKKNF